MATIRTLRDPEGIHNFREVGPYPLGGGGSFRTGMIYRAGALEQMTAEDAAFLSEELALRTILDLRHHDEIAMRVGPHPLEDRVQFNSIFPDNVRQEELIAELNGLYGPGISPGRYMHYLQVGGDRLARAFSLFADEANYPFLVHCTAGKDRTGVLVGMIMDVVGVAPDDIAHEYGLSDRSIDRLLAYLRASGRVLEGTEDEVRARLSTPPEKMAGFLELLYAKHGNAANFFLSQGVPEETLERVKRNLSA
jgi:protein-tyrosine phosphatase